jgi:hypothetical protein
MLKASAGSSRPTAPRSCSADFARVAPASPATDFWTYTPEVVIYGVVEANSSYFFDVPALTRTQNLRRHIQAKPLGTT